MAGVLSDQEKRFLEECVAFAAERWENTGKLFETTPGMGAWVEECKKKAAAARELLKKLRAAR